jgi:hypothetical protein
MFTSSFAPRGDYTSRDEQRGEPIAFRPRGHPRGKCSPHNSPLGMITLLEKSRGANRLSSCLGVEIRASGYPLVSVSLGT